MFSRNERYVPQGLGITTRRAGLVDLHMSGFGITHHCNRGNVTLLHRFDFYAFREEFVPALGALKPFFRGSHVGAAFLTEFHYSTSDGSFSDRRPYG